VNPYAPLIADPYELGSNLFFGDNTTSAAGNTTLSSLAVNAVPEPGLFSAGCAAGVGLVMRRKRQR
jgi:hypothetical protein